MNKLEILIIISYSCQSYANLIDTIFTPNLDIPKSEWHFFYPLGLIFHMILRLINSFVGASVIGHGLMLSLSIAKLPDLLNSQLPVYDGDRQAPPDLLNLLLEGTDLDTDEWLMHHKSIPAFPRRNTSASSNRKSFGSKRYF
jgi:hypothetical protein